MKKDWLETFLPIWMFGTIIWMIMGFVLMPEAFRRPLIRDEHELWIPMMYDITSIDPEIAAKLGIIIGLPALLALTAVLITAVQQYHRSHKTPAPDFK